MAAKRAMTCPEAAAASGSFRHCWSFVAIASALCPRSAGMAPLPQPPGHGSRYKPRPSGPRYGVRGQQGAPARKRLTRVSSEIQHRAMGPSSAKIVLGDGQGANAAPGDLINGIHHRWGRGGRAGSPMPPQCSPPEREKCVSTAGASTIFTTRLRSKFCCTTWPFSMSLRPQRAAERP